MKHLLETDIAAVIENWLKLGGWTVYKEVKRGGKIADLVAVMNKKIWVIETKTSFSLKVIDQILGWIGCANFLSIGVPMIKTPFYHLLKLLGERGIGILTPRDNPDWYKPDDQVLVYQAAEYFRVKKHVLERWHFYDQQKDIAGGSGAGAAWTPFKATVTSFTDYVKYHPGCTFKEAIEGIAHHYRGDKIAIVNIRQWLKVGIIKGIRYEESKLYWEG